MNGSFFDTEQLLFQHMPVKWNQRVQVIVPAECFAGEQAGKDDQKSYDQAPESGEGGADQKQNTHKFDRIVQLRIGLGIVGDRDKCHVQHDLGIEPSGIDGEFSDDQTGDDGERCTQHIRGMDGGQSKAVNGKLQDQELPEDRNVDRVLDPDKLQVLRDPLGIIHKQKKKRSQDQGDNRDQQS